MLDGVEKPAPDFDAVCRDIPVPVMSGPEINRRRELTDVADEQTVAMRHIAGSLSRMADWSIMQGKSRSMMGDLTYTAVVSVSNWLKWGVVIQALSVVGTCIWVLLR